MDSVIPESFYATNNKCLCKLVINFLLSEALCENSPYSAAQYTCIVITYMMV